MVRAGGGLGRILAMGVGLAVLILLGLAAEARANRYSVAQCGWYLGLDADWADTTGAVKYRPDSFCVPPGGGDPFAGSLVRTWTTAAGTVSGTRFGRWRWIAPAGTYLTQVRGFWWHQLNDGIEQRLGSVDFAGTFTPLRIAAATDLTPSEFVIGFPAPAAAFEDRLLCARGEDKFCSLVAQSWSSVRALTLTLEDTQGPSGAIGGDLTAPGWRRGVQTAAVSAGDLGSGVLRGETWVDGALISATLYPCASVNIGGVWRGARLQPCESVGYGSQAIGTAILSDGPHSLVHCVIDFSENVGCTAPVTLLTDNGAPTQPHSAAVVGDPGWRRGNDFDLAWGNPQQGAASPIAGVGARITGANGYDSGTRFTPGRDRTTLENLSVPGPGRWSLQLWLRDEVGNEAPAAAVTVPLLFDDVAPSVAFAGEAATPADQVVAMVADPLSGPASGSVSYRRVETESWKELPTKLLAGAAAGTAELRAPLPPLGAGTWLFRVEAADAAGNAALSTLRGDGTRMELRVGAAAAAAGREAEEGRKTRLFARLLAAGGRGDRERPGGGGRGTLTVPFGAAARVAGRLTDAAGAGLAGRAIRVFARPSRGALGRPQVLTARSGERGGFEVELAAGTSRRVTVSFAGAEGLAPARRSSLALRVRAGVVLRATPRRLSTGGSVRLRGSVAAGDAALPRRGKLVAIQYLERASGKWRPVLVTRSDQAGRFRARYRFRYVSGTASVRLRATAPAEEGWAYAPGSSRPLTVEVRGR